MGTALVVRLALAAALAGPLACSGAGEPGVPEPDLVALPRGSVTFRPAGEFLRAGLPVGAPVVTASIGRRFSIMRRQVTADDYRRCVADGACSAAGSGKAALPDHPAVNISWRDAQAYAKWLSAKTGRRYRLPSEAEWAYAAGSRFRDDSLADVAGADRAERWIARYEKESSEDRVGKETRPAGSFGANEKGLVDLAGNVWEWTSACFLRVTLDAAGKPVGAPIENCGVRVLEGRHRAYVSDFVRDARSGGCAAGIPPANLGFRLVRDPDLWAVLRRLFGPAPTH